eukprot:COSAG06_NODE_413_length_16040_cov_8.901386_5_plen_75_part_00
MQGVVADRSGRPVGGFAEKTMARERARGHDFYTKKYISIRFETNYKPARPRAACELGLAIAAKFGAGRPRRARG